MKTFLSLLLLFVSSLAFAQKQTQFTINFDFNKYEIRPAAAAKLDSFATAIGSTKTNFTIELYGHCDSVGSNEYNDALSVKRTGAVKNYLAAKNVQSSFIVKEEGLGKRQPLNNNASDHDRYLNRRVVVTVITIEPPVVVVPEKPVEKIIEPPVEKTITAIVADTATKVGSKIALKSLNFVGGRHYLLPSSAPILKELLAIMNDNPKLEISIEGHVCCLPDKNDGVDFDYGTLNLSEMRAKTVYDYLVRSGIASKRLSYKGFGHQFPIYPYPEKSIEEMEGNRRVEIKIVNK